MCISYRCFRGTRSPWSPVTVETGFGVTVDLVQVLGLGGNPTSPDFPAPSPGGNTQGGVWAGPHGKHPSGQMKFL